MLSLGRVRRALQPVVVKYWLNRSSAKTVRTRVGGLNLQVLPGVFHPKYFGSSEILANFISSLPLREKSFLEIGCGSGVVALCGAKAGAEVTAIDINPTAVQCTIANAAANKLQVTARVGDLFSSVNGARFDVIAWNPPFLPVDATSPSDIAFYGGRRFDLIRRFAGDAHDYLEPGGSIYTVTSSDVSIEQIEQIFRDEAFGVSRVFSASWWLGETMVILCAR
jgi:release factor glutamine methyltransferase